MIHRLVKLTFDHKHIDTFLQLFQNVHPKIEAFQGCQQVKLWQANDQKNVWFTYSIWDSPSDLEAYRHSDLFRETWAITKTYFADKPQAWSLQEIQLPQSSRE